jgi:hypothetical protein
MNFFFNLIHDYPLIFILHLAFTVWMLIDAYQRGVEQFWFLVILFVPVIGPWIYFFAVKAPDLRNFHIPFFNPRESLDALRHRAEHTPTLANHLALGERLIEEEDFPAALASLEKAHRLEPEHGQVLYFLAFCNSRLNQPEFALPYLEKLTKRDPRWSNYRAWRLLVDVHIQRTDQNAAIAAGRELVKLSPLLEHKCVLGELLLDNGHAQEAVTMLEQALQDHQFTPGPIRRRNRRWAKEAQRLLKRVPSA